MTFNNRPKMKLSKLAAILLPLALMVVATPAARADLVISDIVITASTFSARVSGTIPSGYPATPSLPDYLFFGVPGDSDWITNTTGHLDAWVTNSGKVANSGTNFINSALNSSLDGDYFHLKTADFSAWTTGDLVDATISITGASIDPTKINPEEFIVAAGYGTTNPFPDATYQVGSAGMAVPEPSSLLLASFGIGLAIFRRRRV